jgi:Ras-related protein Rab-6A
MESQELSVSISNFKKYKLVFLGDQSVGKSCIISRYVYDSFDPNSNPTIGVDFVVKSVYSGDNTYKIHFWDTAGQERFQSLIPSYIKDCQVAILVYDITSRKSFENLNKWYNSILNERGDDIIIGILANKVDLGNREVSTEEGFKKAEGWKALFQECSAKTGENVTSFFKLVLDMMIRNSEEGEGEGEQSPAITNLEKKKSTFGNNTANKRCC